jgi:hypothetical protein
MRAPAGLLALVCAACYTPHGTGPMPLPAGPQGAAAEGSVGYGLSKSREIIGAQASLMAHPGVDWFAIQGALRYTRIRSLERPGDVANSTILFVPPTAFVGPVTVSVPLSGFILAGPQGGWSFGMAGVSAGIAQPSWGVQAGVLWDGSQNYGNGFSSKALEVTLEGRYAWDWEGLRLGIAPTVLCCDHTYARAARDAVRDRFWMGILMLTVGYADKGPATPARK